MSLTRDALQASSVEPNAAWQKALGCKLSVARLDELPAGLVFDDALDEPIWYDAARKLLCYRGFMCNASYVILRRLGEEPRYIAALEQLYLASAVEEEPAGKGWLLKLAAPLALSASVLAAGAWYWLH